MNTKRIALGLLLVACLLPVVVASDSQQQKKLPCADAETQFEMNQCARKEHEAADAELNKVYSRLAAKLDEEQRGQLKAAELAWIKYRDMNCDFEGAFYKGGTMRPMVQAYCLARMTNDRTAELKQQIETYEQ
ncbi:MAG: DUF1311 domain-containing protein [Rubrivivax sp.]|nr:DUF1311 domain-containing protein [Pyrinomonadaceae bacterium]